MIRSALRAVCVFLIDGIIWSEVDRWDDLSEIFWWIVAGAVASFMVLTVWRGRPPRETGTMAPDSPRFRGVRGHRL